MIKVILFDADGVVIIGKMFSAHLAEDYGISQDTTKSFFAGVLKECVIGKADLRKVLPPYLKDWGWKGTTDEFIHYWNTSEHNIERELIDYVQLLRKKKIICCLATNQTKYRLNYMLKEMEFSTLFDKVYASSQLGSKKPDVEFYSKIIKDLCIVDKKEVLLWDDTTENIEGAHQFGIYAELYTSFNEFKVKIEKYLQ